MLPEIVEDAPALPFPDSRKCTSPATKGFLFGETKTSRLRVTMGFILTLNGVRIGMGFCNHSSHQGVNAFAKSSQVHAKS